MKEVEFHRAGRVAVSEPGESAGAFRSGEGDGPSLLAQYLSILRRRKWVLLGAIAACLLIGFTVTLLMTPQYTAAATLEIQREQRNFTSVEGAEPQQQQQTDLEFYETQYGLLRSRSLADRVATELRLFDNANFFEMFGSRDAREWFEDGRVIPNASTREQRIDEAGRILLDNFQVAPIRLSRLADIIFTSPDPELSQRVVDAWGQNFIRTTLERKFEATSYARRFLEQRLGQLRSRIDESERRLVAYAAREGIVNLPASTPAQGEGGVTGERSIVVDDLASLNRELSRATADRIAAQSRLGANGGAVAEALQNDAISRLRERQAELASEYARLMVQFEPDYPPARSLQTQIRNINQSIAREEARVQQSLRAAFEAAREREQSLRERVNSLQSGVLDLRRRSIQYNIFQRDVDTNRQLYDALLQRYKEIGVAGGVGVNNISIVDAAEVPEEPSSPNLMFNILLALMAGVALGVGGAIALEQIDEGIGDPTEVQEKLEVPLLGTVPKASGEDPVELLEDRKSSLSEAYLSLQTNLAFSTDHGVPRSLAVTSSNPQEGKSTTSYALAQVLARAGRRTILVDADMRSPNVHHYFGMKNERGLSNFLSGDDNVETMIHPTSRESLFALFAGPQPPSAAELLSTDRLARLIPQLLTEFDHIIIDAPPVMGLADAPLIARAAEGTVFVIESHRTQRSKARVAVGRLKAVGSAIFGAVLTKFDVKRAHYGYGYDYGYGYGYGRPDADSA